jgi:hypothetical protein
MRSVLSIPARLGAALALVVGGIGATVLTSAGPAAATECLPPYHGHTVSPGNNITAWDSVFCFNGPGLPLPIFIYANGVLVASGRGSLTYNCPGSAETSYVIKYVDPTTEQFDAACG